MDSNNELLLKINEELKEIITSIGFDIKHEVFLGTSSGEPSEEAIEDIRKLMLRKIFSYGSDFFQSSAIGKFFEIDDKYTELDISYDSIEINTVPIFNFLIRFDDYSYLVGYSIKKTGKVNNK